MVFWNKHKRCKKCGKQSSADYKWCKQCQKNYLKADFINWTSGNEKIDDFIQEMQLKFDYQSFLFEWIPYNQFNDFKEMDKGGLTAVYSAIWKNGPLYYGDYKWRRNSNKKV